uniref:Rho-GAP domain-containing protein n=1 Tax=Scylla olivacea TaxID=85551 RepID=A0A0N7ZD21_SCYOL
MSVAQIQPEDSDGCIQKQLWRLRHEDPTQYHTLVKMHLSFATDLPTDECDRRISETTTSRRWQLTPLIKKLSRAAVSSKGVMEGAPLTQEGVCQVFQVIHYLNKENNITQEGLFRKNGSLSRQQELKNLLNSGADLNLDCGPYSPHDCASVLKSFLADLPEPLLTEAHYPIHCRIAEMLQSHMSHTQKAAVHTRQIKALRLLFLLLPPENYQLLHDLLILLHRVASHQKQNLMSAINLGTMFAPHILCPRKMTPNDLQYLSGPLSIAVAFMIEQVPHLFQIPLELEYDVRQYWSNKKKMHHQLSKRSLMDAPANTIFTFIDRELTAQANDKDVTEVALAELYAYVQALPDSAKKRKLIKQFNTASGLGTPQLNQSVNKKQEARGRRLGESIKKHLFHKTVKPSKLKCQPFSSLDYTKVKRTNSEDLLTSPSARSPELRMFRHNPELSFPCRMKAKSLEDLSSSFNSHLFISSSTTTDSFISTIAHPAFHPNSSCLGGTKQTSGPSAKHRDHQVQMNTAYCSCSINGPLSPFSTPASCLNSTCEIVDGGVCSPYQSFKTPPAECPKTPNLPPVLDASKESAPPWNASLASTPVTPTLEVHSPISQAVMKASIPQRVIMTPRSRCPIIINSSSSLSNVTIPEENAQTPVLQSIRHQLTTPEDIHTSPIITNPTALLTSPKTLPTQVDSAIKSNSSQDCFAKLSDADSEDENSNKVKEESHMVGGEMKGSRWSSSSLRRTLSSANSTTSLFGSFFRHLSTTSLAQLATKLSSTTSLHRPEDEEKEESEEECEENDDLNESLSSVFKGYLLSRSILTDSPVDLSVVYVDDEGNEDNDSKEKSPFGSKNNSENDDDSAYESSQPPSKTTSRQCSKASLSSLDSAHDLYSSSELSESLLHCLDGHDPSQAEEKNGDSRTQSCNTKPKHHSVCSDSEQSSGLYSCSPDGRSQSILKTKQGTPVPQRESSHTGDPPGAHGVIFETSL